MQPSLDNLPSKPSTGVDVLVIGGGVMGAATACFLARDHGCTVTVLERDRLYTRASSALSASSIRQQFSTQANMALSAWSMGFLRRVQSELAVDGQPPLDIGLVEAGYLYLATAQGRAGMANHHALQRSAGADVALLQADELKTRFPWLEVQDLALASLGLSGEGWFDGPGLHQGFVRKAQACGVRFLQAQALDFDRSSSHEVQAVLTACGQRLPCGAVVLAAGAWTAPLAARLQGHLPVVPKKRDVFVLDSPAAPLPGCPLVIDPSGVWFRPEGSGFLAGAPPRPEADGGPGDPDEPPLDWIDHALFDEVIWPTLASRVPAFEAMRVRSAWAGYYEMNTFDHNGLVGRLPGWSNVYTACGFSGHGMQQAPAVGCALAASISHVPATGPDIQPFDPLRVVLNQPLLERNII
ncbi:MAG: NAD(P)/FAD-dependent oxidoreductase [Betaproteobacteria bacterium]